MALCSTAIALTIHIGFAAEYNGFHPNIMCTTENVIGSIALNSENNISLYGGIAVGDYLDIGLATGYSGGYPISPVARLKYKNFFIMPGYDGNAGIVLGINIPFGGGG